MFSYDKNFWTGFAVGVPTGIAIDETARFIYRKLSPEKEEEKKDSNPISLVKPVSKAYVDEEINKLTSEMKEYMGVVKDGILQGAAEGVKKLSQEVDEALKDLKSKIDVLEKTGLDEFGKVANGHAAIRDDLNKLIKDVGEFTQTSNQTHETALADIRALQQALSELKGKVEYEVKNAWETLNPARDQITDLYSKLNQLGSQVADLAQKLETQPSA